MNKILGEVSHALGAGHMSQQHGAGQLQVQVVEARSLANKDTFSKSDPYVILSVQHKGGLSMFGSEYKTKTIDNNLNPVWNESFNMSCSDPSTDILRIKVKDSDPIKDDIIGTVDIPLSHLQGAKNEWFNLQPHNTGSVHLILTPSWGGSSGSFQQAGGAS
eukprot:TRINITY_DN172_c0_g1_i2.p1 TRINITY_DN172_c0_g1~~TRINITY_DN172_c0_g1_i2.p1  ORF type:complete len:161 (-),score=36.17 TRINITY_DN172_c0_g1_i2:568-1050(-)